MKQTLSVSTALLGLLALSSCSGKLGSLSADNFTVTPSPLEVVGDVVPATINGRFPEKYMKKKAVVTVVPELRYAGTKTVGQSATFQGENVVGNDQTIAYKVGGNYVMRTNFPAQIKYLINQAKVRTSELNRTSVQDFVKMLREIKADRKNLALDNIEVAAYASPDGSLGFNTQLAENRRNTAEQYVHRQLSKNKLGANVDTKYTAEDWEGFKELVQQSNIQDKEAIIRVLSLYQDPEEREQQIRNISAAFTELADEVLPELRRARLAINYRVVGRTDDEIREQYVNDASKLSVEEVLYAATLTNNLEERKAIFEKAARLYPNDKRAHNGLAQIAYAKGDLETAKAELAKATELPEANANAALIAVREHRLDQAEALLGKALSAANYNEVLGNLLVARGNFVQAAQTLKGVKTNTAALAQILTKDYVSARQTLTAVPNRDAMTAYLSAVVGARTGDVKGAAQALAAAIAADHSLAGLAQTDLELAKVLAAHPELVK